MYTSRLLRIAPVPARRDAGRAFTCFRRPPNPPGRPPTSRGDVLNARYETRSLSAVLPQKNSNSLRLIPREFPPSDSSLLFRYRQVEWDYVPQNYNFINGPTEGEEFNVYVREDIFIGKTYIKVSGRQAPWFQGTEGGRKGG